MVLLMISIQKSLHILNCEYPKKEMCFLFINIACITMSQNKCLAVCLKCVLVPSTSLQRNF